MAAENHIETFKLLNVSESNSESEEFVTLPPARRKSKIRRKFRPIVTNKDGASFCSLTVLVKIVSILVIVILFALIGWCLFNLYRHIRLLSQQMRDMEAGTRKTPEEFHNVHARLKSLEDSSDVIRDNITKLATDLAIVDKQVKILIDTTDNLSKSIAAAPQIQTLPKYVTSLQENVASMGSKITNLQTTVKEMKDQLGNANKRLQNDEEILHKMSSVYNKSSFQTWQHISDQSISDVEGIATSKDIHQLELSMDEVNKTLSSKIQEATNELFEHRVRTNGLQNISIVLGKQLEHLQSQIRNNSSCLGSQPSSSINEPALSPPTLEYDASNCSTVVINDTNLQYLFQRVSNLTKIYHALLAKFMKFQNETNGDPNHNLLTLNTIKALEASINQSLEILADEERRQLQVLIHRQDETERRLLDIERLSQQKSPNILTTMSSLSTHLSQTGAVSQKTITPKKQPSKPGKNKSF